MIDDRNIINELIKFNNQNENKNELDLNPLLRS